MRWICCFLLATAAFAHDDDLSLAEAEKKMRAGDYAGALEEYDHAIEHDPNVAKAHAGRAAALYSLGRRDEAFASISRAIELEPDARSYQIRGRMQIARQDLPAAVADFTKALEIAPEDGDLYRERASARRRQCDYAGALADYTKALEVNARDLTALDGRGHMKEALHDYEGAIEDYTTLVYAAPRAPEPFSMRGDVKQVLGRYREAVDDYDAAIYNNPRDAHSYISRARAKLALGDKEGAESDAAEACKPPENAQAFAERGRYYFDTGRPKEAVADLAKAVQMDAKGQDYTRFYLFLARAKLGERETAAAELKAFAASRKEKGDWYAKVVALLTGGMKEDALLAAAKDDNPNRTREQECEASWYSAAVRLLDGDAAGAKPLLAQCIATDVRNFIEYTSAKAALAAMDR